MESIGSLLVIILSIVGFIMGVRLAWAVWVGFTQHLPAMAKSSQEAAEHAAHIRTVITEMQQDEDQRRASRPPVE